MIIIFYLAVILVIAAGISVISYAFKPILTITGLKALTIFGFIKIICLLILAMLIFWFAYRTYLMKEAFFIC